MLGITALLSVSTLLLTGMVPTTVGGVAVDCLQPPVTGRVVAPYVAPPCPYCAGHRTIDFASVLGEAVVSPVAGVVTFYGFVAGRLYITIDPDRSTGYAADVVVTVGGMILDDAAAEGPNPRRGDPVRRGERVGDAGGLPVSLSVRRDGPQPEYLDPTPLVGRWRSAARLVPRTGRFRPPATQLACPGAPNSR